ncbi:MAG: sialidase family protein [Pirellulales bacterium]
MVQRVFSGAFVLAIAFLAPTISRGDDKTDSAANEGGMQLLEVRRIWNDAPHNAFTDLVRHHDRWWCVFREGEAHVSPDGALRIITSADGKEWESAALITSPHEDLRDAKLTIMPDDQFMLSGAGALHKPDPHTHQSYAWFSGNGYDWSDAVPVGDPDYWLWRVTWNKDVCYGIGYGTKAQNLRLYRSDDGRDFTTLVENLFDEGYPNETSIVFLPDDTALCLLRRDPLNGLLGQAKPPYKQWQWQDVGQQIGGPHLIRLPDGRLIAAVRLYDKNVRTALGWIDEKTGKFTEALALPSGGDSSYPGLVWHDDVLWVSYYSSHEDRTSIYLAKVKVPPASASGE